MQDPELRCPIHCFSPYACFGSTKLACTDDNYMLKLDVQRHRHRCNWETHMFVNVLPKVVFRNQSSQAISSNCQTCLVGVEVPCLQEEAAGVVPWPHQEEVAVVAVPPCLLEGVGAAVGPWHHLGEGEAAAAP